MDKIPVNSENSEANRPTASESKRTFRNVIRSPSFWIIILIVAYTAVVSSYNDLTQRAFTVIVRDTTESLTDFSAGTTLTELKASYEFALLSADVYDKKEPTEYLCSDENSLSHWYELEGAEFHDLETMPKEAKDWHGNYADGLEFKIYYRKDLDAQGEQLVVIAFRGTDGGMSDIWSNLHWLTRWILFTYDQYDVVRTIAPELIMRIEGYEKFKGKKTRIVATGHSLGGGLAQQAAYAADRINTVYAFDSSSVTGFYDVDKVNRDERARKMRVYRIYERGEVLAYLRRFMAQIYPVSADNPKIVEARYNFESLKGNFITLHSMENLACNLQMVARKPEKESSGNE